MDVLWIPLNRNNIKELKPGYYIKELKDKKLKYIGFIHSFDSPTYIKTYLTIIDPFKHIKVRHIHSGIFYYRKHITRNEKLKSVFSNLIEYKENNYNLEALINNNLNIK